MQTREIVAGFFIAEENGRLMRLIRNAIVIGFAIMLAIGPVRAGEFDSILRWRNIGPYRGGRTRAICGVPSQPNVFYMAPVNGGVFKSIDYGRTWQPIFDDQPTASVGAIAVALSDPNVIYVGSGEGLHRPDLSVGDGVYKSIDAGKTWTHLGLRDGQQIPQLAVDPKNPNRLFVAVAGHPYGPNEERGVYRSVDGGKTFEKVLYRDENIGASDVQIDPSNPEIVYAALWESREGPWENGVFNGNGGGIFKSVDEGKTWRQLNKGLPDNIVQANLAIAPSAPKTLFAAVKTRTIAKLYRSDDGGETWRGTTDDPRPGLGIGGGDLPVVRFDPKNPQIVYSASIVCWKSTDGGKTWNGWRGAPGGDDYQNIWINPNNPDIILLGADQGAIVTVNGGKSWSSWYNQPTAQLYHVSADNSFPYQALQRSTGKRFGRNQKPRRRRRDYLPRLATCRGRGIWLRRCRSARSRHHHRRQIDAIRSPHWSGAKHSSGAGADGRFPYDTDRASCFFAARPAFAFFRWKHALANARSWRSLGKDQSGFVTTELRAAGEHWKIQGGCNEAGASARRDLHRCAVTARRKQDLVRHRRRLDSSYD